MFYHLEVYEDTFQVKCINGGVARNVAECMSKLGSKPFIVSVVGIDIAGEPSFFFFFFFFFCMVDLLPLGFLNLMNMVFSLNSGEILLRYWESAGLSTEGNYN